MLSTIQLLVAMTGLAASATTAAKAETLEHGWSLVWAEEFNGAKLDRKKWKPEISCWGGGNQERQCYTDRPKNIKVADGNLHLIAHKETFTGPDLPPEFSNKPYPQKTQEYTSGKIRTLGISSWKYGKVEFRAKPPKGQGTWPAVWISLAEGATLTPDPRDTWWPARVCAAEGQLTVSPKRWSSSGDTFSLAGTNALVLVNPESPCQGRALTLLLEPPAR